MKSRASRYHSPMRTVLIIDDNPAVPQALGVLFGLHDIETVAASSAAQGRKEIARCAGTQFDPEIVRAFLGISLRPHRFAGPLAWLGQATVLARFPIGSVAGSLSAAALAVGVTASTGLVHTHHSAADSRARVGLATAPTQPIAAITSIAHV